jgi:hypothetical protein
MGEDGKWILLTEGWSSSAVFCEHSDKTFKFYRSNKSFEQLKNLQNVKEDTRPIAGSQNGYKLLPQSVICLLTMTHPVLVYVQ